MDHFAASLGAGLNADQCNEYVFAELAKRQAEPSSHLLTGEIGTDCPVKRCIPPYLT